MKPRSHVTPQIEGSVFDIQRFSLHDGPGIRTIVFLKGCPLACTWCSNPESQRFSQEVLFSATKCINCRTCQAVCPEEAIDPGSRTDRIDRRRCNRCLACCEECPTRALKGSGKRMCVAEVAEEIEKDRQFYDSSGGGVTLSGGEPLGQPEFLKHLLARCRSLGIHTAVETCGYGRWEGLSAILPHTDLFLYDIKHMDPAAHKKITGRSNSLILENLKKLSSRGAPIIVRVPIVPGVNDSAANLTETAVFAARLNLREVHLLPYHNYGESKYRMLGRDYVHPDLEPPSSATLEAPKRLFEKHGLKVSIGGE